MVSTQQFISVQWLKVALCVAKTKESSGIQPCAPVAVYATHLFHNPLINDCAILADEICGIIKIRGQLI